MALRMCRDAVLKSTCLAVSLSCRDELLDLVGCQMLAGARVSVWCAPRGDCSIFSGIAWLTKPEKPARQSGKVVHLKKPH
jgi:hypothetical protein